MRMIESKDRVQSMLENLSGRLQQVIKSLRGQARLTEENIADAMREASLGTNVKPLIYFAACLPLATGLYFLDCWIIVRSDPLKAAIRTGRTRFR